ncbi:putative BNA3-Arylformamidase [Thamnocephalis sphaerospora]|uniref:Putative BNA3-Arylformamidase n=1 Tax=Thamnocephalis sphaerospora TaxID=78915 RepID=A0A4P9XM91_9FUNG|nr:putative BNA3-Arylformamidase [Thamnocephalis sphaerospora]|eukprot:RKP07023.1 putative BNA3-Arylformamidase [Thamnocephalis sphaerospora]
MSPTPGQSPMTEKSVIQQSDRVAHFTQDVWSLFTRLTLENNAVNLGQGFMNFPAPEFIKQAAAVTVNDDPCNQYSVPKGRLRLRQALSATYSPLFGRTLDPENEVVVTAGANEGIFATLAGYLDQGSEVIIFEPYFDQYLPNITMNGGVPVYCPLRIDSHVDRNGVVPSSAWRVDLDELRSKITPRTKIILLNTPHNPVGKVFSEQELRDIGRIAKENNLLIISDEVYDRLVFKPDVHTRIGALNEFWDRTITVGSAGKTFGITGWRIGWLMGPQQLLAPALAAHTRIVFCVNSPLQEAVAIGFEEADKNGFYERQVAEYERRREKLTRAIKQAGLPYTAPAGSYFVLVDTSKIRIPAGFKFPPEIASRGANFEMCYFLCKEIGVTAIPVSEFYSPENAELARDFVRLAFCKTDDLLDEAARRLQKVTKYIQQ